MISRKPIGNWNTILIQWGQQVQADYYFLRVSFRSRDASNLWQRSQWQIYLGSGGGRRWSETWFAIRWYHCARCRGTFESAPSKFRENQRLEVSQENSFFMYSWFVRYSPYWTRKQFEQRSVMTWRKMWRMSWPFRGFSLLWIKSWIWKKLMPGKDFALKLDWIKSWIESMKIWKTWRIRKLERWKMNWNESVVWKTLFTCTFLLLDSFSERILKSRIWILRIWRMIRSSWSCKFIFAQFFAKNSIYNMKCF